MSELVNEFNDYRSKMNEVILGKQNKVINRLFNLDTNTYAEGALSVKTKEMLGLVASMVLRCDDCIKYHLGKCFEEGVTTEEIYEIFAVANIVGGTIVIPHTRRGAEYWEALIAPDNFASRAAMTSSKVCTPPEAMTSSPLTSANSRVEGMFSPLPKPSLRISVKITVRSPTVRI